MEKKSIKLGTNEVGHGKPVYIICEAGVTNYGELELAKRQVDAAYEARADAVKFQVTKTENLISKKVAARLQNELGYNWFDRVKYKELSFDATRELARYVRTGGYPFFATAHDEEALDFLDRDMGVPFFKVGSGESHNTEFLKNIGRRGKPVIISFGLQSDAEAVRAVETLRDAGAKEIIALHCTTLYPTPYDKIDLGRMLHLRELLGVPVGISDHSVGWHVVLAAVGLGASVVEKHLTFGKNDPRSLDNAGALLPHEFALMVAQIRDVEKARLSTSMEERLAGLEKGRDWAGQSIVALRDIPAGATIARNMLTFKRPAKGGLGPEMLTQVVGKTVKANIPEDEQVLLEHLA
ncbi:MAG: N-acetylneuraminate synthase family protein [Patescibacteria group bacterium]